MTLIQLQVGERRFTSNSDTLKSESDYFKRIFSETWGASSQPDGSLFLDRDGDVFAHILRYLRSLKFPFFYNEHLGHNFALYDQLLDEAKYFKIDNLKKYLEQKTYLQVVRTETSSTTHPDVSAINQTDNSDVMSQWLPRRRMFKVYQCPRGIFAHRGEPDRCGRQCVNRRGETGWQFEDVEVMDIVEVRTKTIFNESLLTGY